MGEFDSKSPGLDDSFFFETPLSYDCVSNILFFVWTPIDGQFGWGGTGLKLYQARPMVNSGGTEIHCRV